MKKKTLITYVKPEYQDKKIDKTETADYRVNKQQGGVSFKSYTTQVGHVSMKLSRVIQENAVAMTGTMEQMTSEEKKKRKEQSEEARWEHMTPTDRTSESYRMWEHHSDDCG